MSRFVSVAGEQMANLVERVAEPGRLSRGRALYRKGCVSELAILDGSVIASVRGSEGDEYETSVGTATAPPGVARQIVQAYAAGGFGAIDDLMVEGVDVCPPDMDLAFACDCADWDEPCKHVLALLLALADRADLEVVELLRWRGVDLMTTAASSEPTVDALPVERESASPKRRSLVDKADQPQPEPTVVSDAAIDADATIDPDDRTARLARLEALLGNTAMRVPASSTANERVAQADVSPELAEFLGHDTSIVPVDLSDITAAAPLFTEVPFGPLADLGPVLATAIETIATALGTTALGTEGDS